MGMEATHMTEAAKFLPTIKRALTSGLRVQVTNYMHSTIYDKRHVDMFAVRNGSLYVRRGRKNWDCIDYCGIRIERAQ